jgi:hypothetical protein
VGSDRGLDIARKVFVNCGCRSSRIHQCDDFREHTAWTLSGPRNDGNSLAMILNHHIFTRADVGHDGCEITRGFGFRDVDGCHVSYDSAILDYSAGETMRATTSYSWDSVIWAL